jgi:DNA-binding response OmpR family regulator
MKKKLSSKKKILIVEDETILAEMYYDVFVQAGFKVFSAVESKKGLEIAKKEKPDLIILDMLLPGVKQILLLSSLFQKLKTI